MYNAWAAPNLGTETQLPEEPKQVTDITIKGSLELLLNNGFTFDEIKLLTLDEFCSKVKELS